MPPSFASVLSVGWARCSSSKSGRWGCRVGVSAGDESEKTVPDNERLSILILILDQDCAVLGTDGTGVLRRSGFGHENLAASG